MRKFNFLVCFFLRFFSKFRSKKNKKNIHKQKNEFTYYN